MGIGSWRALCKAAMWIALFQFGALAAWPAPLPATPSWQQEYWARYDKRDWDAAVTSAEKLVAAARPATHETGLRLAEALSLLGNAQFGKGNLVAAEAAFTEALQLTEQYAGRGSQALVDPLRGLGSTLATQGKHEKAIPYMDRALLLSRRTAGLFDISQEGLLKQLATSLAMTGSPLDGEKHMQYLLRVGEHTYGENDVRMVPLYCIVARWYSDVAQMDQARSNYRTALSVAERSQGHNTLAVVEPLRGLAQTFPDEVALSNLGIPTRKERLTAAPDDPVDDVTQPYNPRYIALEGERALLRALRTLDADPQRSTKTLIETLVQTGDWFLLKMQSDKALSYYKRAAGLIEARKGATSAADDDVGDAAGLLSFPVQVYYLIPPAATRNLTLATNEVTERFVQIEFTVQPDGTITDEREVDHDGTNRHVSQTLEAIHTARYRPRFVDGNPVATTAVGYRQLFKQHKEAE